MKVSWNSNVVMLTGSITTDCLFQFSQALYILHKKSGYQEIILDFSDVDAIFETFMAPAIAVCRGYAAHVDFVVIQPSSEKLANLFHNSNWLHLLAPESFAASTFSGPQHLPAQCFLTSAEQYSTVDRVMDVIIGNLEVERRQLQALEWCINEITDNVLNHADTELGGVVQASTFPARNSVEFVVADAGVGVRHTLGGRDDGEALSLAIQEGVTRNQKTNQGNGLYGSFRVSAISGGHFQMHSGRASLICRGVDDVRIKKQKSALYNGTVVIAQIICNDEELIQQAFVFKGRVHEPTFDYIGQTFESDLPNHLILKMKDEASGFGSRESGRIVRTKLLNLLRNDPAYVVELDFTDVLIISSSFADEAIGKVFLEVGPLQFMRRVKVANADRTIQALLDRAILLRSGQMTLDS